MPGYELAVLDESFRPVSPDQPGILAVNVKRSPLCTFAGYWQCETPSLRGEWCLTGDTMKQDKEGHFFFVARNDDIINSAGYRIGPFDVESALMEHPAVAEVAVIGKPDPKRTEIVKAFAVLHQGFSPSDELVDELQQHVRRRLLGDCGQARGGRDASSTNVVFGAPESTKLSPTRIQHAPSAEKIHVVAAE